MKTEPGIYRQPERTIRQVRLDCLRSLVRARLCPERSVLTSLRCVDNQTETDDHFGSQLWYFEGNGVDEDDTRHNLYGVVEYSVQYGLHELVEDGVFDSAGQRDRFLHLYRREAISVDLWRHPAHRILAATVLALASATAAYLLTVTLIA